MSESEGKQQKNRAAVQDFRRNMQHTAEKMLNEFEGPDRFALYEMGASMGAIYAAAIATSIDLSAMDEDEQTYLAKTPFIEGFLAFAKMYAKKKEEMGANDVH